MFRNMFIPVTIACIVLTFPVSTFAQDWSWPDEPENLQVLPKDFSGSQLRSVMSSFIRGLGVRCSYCHVGQEPQPLSTWDFASDDNPNKNRAREMLRMVKSINGHLDKIEPSGDKRVSVGCHTCHSGRPRPMTLEEELGEVYRTNGIDATVSRYHELRDRYYGRGAYDFGERSLNSFGYSLLQNDDVAGAIAIFELNAEQFPESGNVWDSLAEGYMASGDLEMAQKHYQKSLELNPKNRNAKQMLEKIAQQMEK